MRCESTPYLRESNGRIAQAVRHEDPMLAAEHCSITIVDRFFTKVDKSDGCWNWLGTTTNTGPVIGRGGQGAGNIAARRLSWLIHYGWISPCMKIRMTCRNLLCVRPDHIKPSHGMDLPEMDYNRLEKLLNGPKSTGTLTDYCYQDPTLPEGFSATFRQRFWQKVQKTDTCWLWIGCLNSDGYGSIGKGRDKPGNVIGAHKASWIMHNGPIPDGMVVCHNCPGGDNPACVNPKHLFLGTPGDNSRDTNTKRMSRQLPHWNVYKLDMDSVLKIRTEFAKGGMTKAELARRFSVATTTIHRILNGSSWNRPGCLLPNSKPAETSLEFEMIS